MFGASARDPPLSVGKTGEPHCPPNDNQFHRRRGVQSPGREVAVNRIPFLALALATIAIAASGQDAADDRAEEAVDLAYHPAEGREGRYLVRLEGVVVQQEREMALEGSLVFAARIVETDNEAETVTQRVLFGPGRVRLADRRLGWSLAGRSYTVIRGRSGRIVEVRTRAPAPDENRGDFAAVFHDLVFSTIFAPGPVEVGERWECDLDEEAVVFEPDPAEMEDRTVKGSYAGVLAEVRDVAGARTAVVEGASEVTVVSRAAEVEARWTARVTVDAADGWPVQATGVIESLRIQPAGGVSLLFRDLKVVIEPYVPAAGGPAEAGPAEEEAGDADG